ncbi:hypothetical protein AB0J74_01320 [Asanoa sp. NPDC049573]|uniref:hypothetical protein n=1 Tax=Asanoa sp. NPDC049573 TaxID=3155396 RepID=UPI003447CD2E
MNQSLFSDPGPHAALLDDLPGDVTTVVGAAGPDWRRVADLLDADQRRHPGRPLSAPRTRPVGASTRAAALLTVAALRRRGVPARCRVGFAPRLGYAPRVIATPLATDDDGFVLAGEVWLAYREGVVDAARYGGGAAVRDAVLRDLAHANADEVPLAETWGPMGPDLVGDLDVVDEVAALLVATFLGDEVAERELAERYASDHRIRPPGATARAA